MARRNNRSRNQARQNGHAEAVVVADGPTVDEQIDVIERATQKGSRQEREPLGATQLNKMWYSTVEWVRKMDDMPSRDNCTALDKWCRDRLLEEPYLAGIVSRAVSAQANRGWSLYGGKRVTEATSRMLHTFDPVSVRLKDGRVVIDSFKSAGWRRASKRKALSYNTRNGGAFVEMQRRLEPRFTRNGWSLSPVSYLYNMDTGLVEWTGDALYPIRYDGSHAWPNPSFYQIMSMPSDEQEHYHMGLSPLYRCIRLAVLMVEISEWEAGTLADDFIDSVLLLNGTDEDEFNKAMANRKVASVGGKKNKAKRAAVLGNIDPALKLEADLIRLRSMPDSLHDFEGRITLLLQGYAVNLGYSLSHFMDTSSSRLLGQSGAEADFIQKTTSESGGNDYHREDEEALNEFVVPANVEFHYDEQGVDDAEDAQLKELRSETLERLYLASRGDTEGGVEYLGTTEQFRQLAIEWDLFDPEWTEQVEDVRTDHDDQTRYILQQYMERPAVQRCIHAVEEGIIRDDSLIHYSYNPETNQKRTRTMVRSVQEMIDGRQRFFAMLKVEPKRRATEDERVAALAIMKRHLTDAQEVAGVAQNG